jgi:hypothetical protein
MSNSTPRPGKGSGEHIPDTIAFEYNKLNLLLRILFFARAKITFFILCFKFLSSFYRLGIVVY